MSDGLTMSLAKHVHAVISSCAQMIYTLRVLRAHDTDDNICYSLFTVLSSL